MVDDATDTNWDGSREKAGWLWLPVFVVSLVVFAFLTQLLLGSGYSNPSAGRLLDALSAGGPAESLGRVYPVIPYLFSRGFSEFPPIAASAPYFADCLAAAALVALAYARLRASGCRYIMAAVLIIALVANPMFLFAATGGSGLAWALLLAYVFAVGVMALGRERYLRGGLLVGLAYTGVLLSSPLGIYILLISAPILVLASRQQIMSVFPPSIYVALAVLPLAVLAILVGAHHALTGEMGIFLESMAGNPNLTREGAALEPWPFLMANSPVAVAGVVLAGLFICFPVLALSLSGLFAGANMLRATLIVALVAMITGVVTTWLGVLSHPSLLWAFAIPPTLVALEHVRHGFGGRAMAVFALLLGISGSWWLMGLHPNLNLTVWRAEIGTTFAEAMRGFPPPAEAASRTDR